MNTTYEDFETILVPIANEYARKFGKFGVDREDIAQELRIWVFRHPAKIEEWAESEDGADKPVARSLRHEASRYCNQEKARFLGYSYNDLTWYSRGELKVLLDAVFDREAWTEPPVSEDGGRSQRDPAVGGNWVAMLADVARALTSLSEADQLLLRAFHEDQYTNVMLAELNGVTPQAMSQRHIKALNRLLRVLGGERPQSTHDDPCECEPHYVGTRTVMSNAASRAAQESYYQEN